MKATIAWKRRLPAAALVLLSLGFGFRLNSAQSPASPTLHGDRAHPAKTQGWVDTQLYFGLGPADDASKGISEAEWRKFLDKEVTPRFPAGLSVVDVYGQWHPEQDAGDRLPQDCRE
jgi:hypothetical protein